MTIDTGAVCRSIDCTGYTNTLTHTAGVTWTIGDATAGTSNNALKFVAGMTYTLGDAVTSAISFASTAAAAQTIDFSSKSTGSVTYGTAGNWQLTGTHNTSTAAGIVTLTLGTLDTNGQTCAWGILSSSNSNTRTLTLGASNITISGAGNAWNFSTPTGLTFNSNTSTITFTGTTGNTTLQTGSKTFSSVVFNVGGSVHFMGGNGTFTNFTVNSGAFKTGQFRIGVNNTATVTGLLTLSGQSATNRLVVYNSGNNGTGTQGFVIAAAPTVSNVDFMDITITGAAAPLTGTSLGDALGNTGITFTGAVTRYGVVAGSGSSTAMWSTSSGGAGGASVPLPQDTVILDALSAAGTYSMDMPRLGADLTFTGFTRTFSMVSAIVMYGSLTVSSTMTISGTFTLAARSAKTFTSAGKNVGNVTISAPNGTYSLQDNLTVNSITLNFGTLDTNGKSLTSQTFSSNAATVRGLQGATGTTWTLSGTATIFTISSTLTLTGSMPTLNITDTSATNKTVVLSAAFTYPTITVTGSGTGQVFFNTGTPLPITTLTINAPKTVVFTAGATYNLTTFNATGSAGNIITLQSSTPTTAYNFSKTSGTVSCDYLSITDSHAAGGASYYAGTHSTDAGGNTGWIFTAPPGGGGGLLLMGAG